MMTNCLLVRADADASIGTGHVMRCIALAQAWQQAGGQVVFASRTLPDALQARLTAESITTVPISAANESADIAQTIAVARDHQATCIVLDGYHLGAQHQCAIREAGVRQLALDDYGHAEKYCADFVLNQNISADAALYANRSSDTTLLLGTRYALLRREFTQHADAQRSMPTIANKIIVTMGGADSENVTAAVLQSLSTIATPDFHVKVVVGPANPNLAALQSFVANANFRMELLSSPAMPELMQWADVAVSATGSTCWELMFMQVPFIGIALADNQRAIAQKFQEEGIATTFQWPTDINSGSLAQSIRKLALSANLRSERAKVGRKYVDGRGASRVVATLNSPIKLSAATEAECRLIWDWANDPEVRAVSFDSKPIPWDDHSRWYAAQLIDPNTRFWIARNASCDPIGQVRFAIDSSDATISVSLAPGHRGKGYGTALISSGAERLFSENQTLHLIHAYIKVDNRKSVIAFERAGFVDAGTTTIKGLPALHYVLDRN